MPGQKSDSVFVAAIRGVVVLAGLLLLSAPGNAAADECVRPGGARGCHPTIQEAVDVASAGALVEIFPGTYSEQVTVAVAGLRLAGMGTQPDKVLLDGGGTGTALSIDAADVSVRNLTVRNAGVGIMISQPRPRVVNVRVLQCATEGVRVLLAAEGAIIRNSLISEIGIQGLAVDGDGVVIRNTTVRDALMGGILVSGASPRLLRNRVTGSERSFRVSGADAVLRGNRAADGMRSGIEVSGDRAGVFVNRILWTRSTGLTVSGADPTVEGNLLSVAETGIDVNCVPCTGGLVEANAAATVFNCPGYSLMADAPGLVVRDNRASSSSDEGFFVRGPGIVLVGNEATYNGWTSRPGFDVQGDDIRLKGNLAFGNAMSGFRVAGTGLLLQGNASEENLDRGFELDALVPTAGALLVRNTALGNLREGISVGPGVTGTVLRRNISRGNMPDFCDQGTGTVLGTGVAANKFGTTCPP